MSEGVSAEDEGSSKEDDDEEGVTSGLSPLSEGSNQVSPLSDAPSSANSPSQSEPAQTDQQKPLSNGTAASEEPAEPSNHVSVPEEPAEAPPTVTNGVSSPPSPEPSAEKCSSQTNHSTSPPPSVRTTRSQKRKREETSVNTIIHDSRCSEGHLPPWVPPHLVHQGSFILLLSSLTVTWIFLWIWASSAAIPRSPPPGPTRRPGAWSAARSRHRLLRETRWDLWREKSVIM